MSGGIIVDGQYFNYKQSFAILRMVNADREDVETIEQLQEFLKGYKVRKSSIDILKINQFTFIHPEGKLNYLMRIPNQMMAL